MNIYEKLLNIQNELKAPKGQKNTFGNYNYRSCEDILEAVKPLCVKYECVLTICDQLECIGERYYIKAIATLDDIKKEENQSRGMIQNTAYAREEEIKKGMDASQITGACSSYARKYALNGLFCIDDTKDADTDAYKKQEERETSKDTLVSELEANSLHKILLDTGLTEEKIVETLQKGYKVNSTAELKKSQYAEILRKLNKGDK